MFVHLAMGRRSYSPSPPPRGGYGRRRRSPSPRGHYGGGGRGRDLPTSLLVRNLRHECRPEDLQRPFGQFGPLKDIYLPRDYYSGEPRGIGFVQFIDPAEKAGGRFSDRRRSPPSRYSRSPPPRYARSPSCGREYSPPPKRRQYSRSISPRHRRYSRERSYSRSPVRERSRSYEGSPRSPSRCLVKERSPPYSEPRSRSRSPVRSPSRSRSRSRSGEARD
ncbi:hypothetical protein R6Q59_011824 [Mikania micrantha]